MNILMLAVGDAGLDDPNSESVARQLEYARRAGGRVDMIVDSPRRGISRFGALTVYRTGASRIGYLAAVRRWTAEALRHARPDLITAQDPFGSALAGLQLRNALRRPLLIQNHSSFLFNGYWLRERPLAFRALHLLARFTLPRADGWRVVNERERRIYFERLGIAAHRVKVLPVPCDLAPFEAARISGARAEVRGKLGVEADAPLLVWAGRPVRVKRLPVLFEAFAQVLAAMPAARLLLCGDRALAQENVGRAAERAGVASSLTWLGALPRAELAEVVAAGDVFVMASAYEGFGRVLAEAGAAGVPAVSTATAGAETIVKDGGTGYLVPVEDAEKMGARILALLRNPESRNRMGAAAAVRVRKHFDPERAFEGIVDQWRAVAEQGVRK